MISDVRFNEPENPLPDKRAWDFRKEQNPNEANPARFPDRAFRSNSYGIFKLNAALYGSQHNDRFRMDRSKQETEFVFECDPTRTRFWAHF
ncbi:hypothetical protein LEP1GSC120_2783 [Leptospira santarosai str. 200702252]|nr:hypothetical protein LEP1GSC130_0080 [Leptospira santarosai str. 200403458]EMP00087.1 hypothetical protein LEP1GSC120_2783 [Leptospira santarosai str. 200702252]